MAFMSQSDALAGAHNLCIVQRRPATHAVPAEQQLGHDFRVNAVPQQVAGQGCDGVVAYPGWHAVVHQSAPIG